MVVTFCYNFQIVPNTTVNDFTNFFSQDEVITDDSIHIQLKPLQMTRNDRHYYKRFELCFCGNLVQQGFFISLF
jgi:hypothetical protein